LAEIAISRLSPHSAALAVLIPVVVYTLLMQINRILMYISLAVIAVGASVMIGMLIWSYRLDADFSASYACCTQQADADFHRWFWMKFFLGATLALTGCLSVSIVVSSKTAAKAGLVALGIGILGLFLTFSGTNMHGWRGASALMLTAVAFGGGVVLLIIGGCRFGWTKLRSKVR